MAKRWIKRFECPVDEHADYKNTYWCNRDLIPIPFNRRTWTWQGFAGYWVIAGINTTAWTAGSSLLALGLSVGQAMGVVIGASLIIAVLAVGAGWMGSHQYIGFTVLSRSSWGMYGGFWPVLNRVVTGCVWMGIQMYWGGQAVRVTLGGLIGMRFVHMQNTLPPAANIETVDLVSFFIFVLLFLPALLFPPENLQMPFRIAFIMITGVLFGMLIWALVSAKGAGDLIHTGSTMHGKTLSWNTAYGIQSFLGAYGGGVLGQSDWTRYARSTHAAIFGQGVTATLAICITALCGILITSASANFYGGVYWNPFLLLIHTQQRGMTPAARAGTFFAGLGLLASQLALCIVLNSVSAGMDAAALCPKYINIQRGAYIITIIGIAICPWQYVTRATTFIVVLSSWSVFLAPMTGVLISDYFLVRHRELHIADLYLGSSKSVYWYNGGFNWRAMLAWCMGLWPLLPGFVRRVKGTNSLYGNGWDHAYELSYFVGFLVAGAVHAVLHMLFPAEGQRGSSPFALLSGSKSSPLEMENGKDSKEAQEVIG